MEKDIRENFPSYTHKINNKSFDEQIKINKKGDTIIKTLNLKNIFPTQQGRSNNTNDSGISKKNHYTYQKQKVEDDCTIKCLKQVSRKIINIS